MGRSRRTERVTPAQAITGAVEAWSLAADCGTRSATIGPKEAGMGNSHASFACFEENQADGSAGVWNQALQRDEEGAALLQGAAGHHSLRGPRTARGVGGRASPL